MTQVTTISERENNMKKSHVLRASALLIGLSLVGVACSSDSDSSSDTATGGAVTCDGTKIAFFGALTGDAGNLGQNIKKGVDLAVTQFNAANADCQITVEAYDSQGDPDQAPALAQKAIDDANVLGIVGPAFSGESKAALPLFEEAGLPIISPSSTNALLSTNGWKVFHRALGGDDKQGPGIAAKITSDGKTKVGIVDDNSEYGKGLADIIQTTLGASAVELNSLDAEGSDYSAVVSAAKDAGVDSVFFGGYYAAAGKLAKQLADGGVKVQMYFGDGVNDKGFVEAAGPAGEGAIIGCTCAPVDSNPEFYAAFKVQFNEDPATYSAEAYDATNAFLDALVAGNKDRASINTFLSTYDKAGVTKQIKWDATGEVAG